MPKDLSQNFDIIYPVVISTLGLFLAGMLTVYPLRVHENLIWRKPLIGSVFASLCIFGILAVFFPKRCSEVFDFGRRKPSRLYLNNLASHKTSSTLQGHHPDCENFAGHVLQIDEKKFCAACTGLLLGGLSTLVGTLLYFFGNWRVGPNSSLIVWIGVVGVASGLFQLRFRSFARVFLNIFFVLGTFFILVGVDSLTHSVAVDLFLVALIVFWLFTRISLSRWDHERICYSCKVATCELSDRKGE